MDTRKVLGIIFSILFVGAFTFVLCWGIINFNKVKESMSGTAIYTQEDVNNAYQDGYDTALEDKAEYDELINGYRDTITTLNDNISKLNSQVSTLTNANNDCQTKINSLNNIISQNESTIENLNNTITTNNSTIDYLTSEINILSETKTNLETQITALNNNITNKEVIISGLNSQIVDLQNDINYKRTQIVELNNQVTALQIEIDELSSSDNKNAILIENLNSQIVNLNNEIKLLENSIANKTSEIETLNSHITTLNAEITSLKAQVIEKVASITSLENQVANLTTLNSQLEQTNESNTKTISTLNNQIVNLNSQISELTLQIQNNSTNVSSLNNKIAELENSIAYYEQYIAGLESNDQVVATFEFNGSVYNIQVLPKNSYASVINPESDNYVTFNGWTVNGQTVDVSTYPITQNTKFVADITCKYDVVFKVDGNEYNRQIVVENNLPTIPATPVKDGYEFDGWSLDGVNVIDINTYLVKEHSVFIAKFTKLHIVNFVYESETISTQSIRNGNIAKNIAVEDTVYKKFNGWKVNGSLIDITTYKVSADTTFVADITYSYDVVFSVDNSNYDSQIIVSNHYVAVPENPTKAGYVFDGWMLNNEIVNPANVRITANTTFVAKFTKLLNVSFVVEGETISTQQIRNGEVATTINVDSTAYRVFNGWTINNNIVNVSEYEITENTIFTASITYKYDVTFLVDDAVFNSQIVAKNGSANIPNNPTKSGYMFDGWTTNGTDIVNVSTYTITKNTTFIAKFTRQYTVTFKYEDNILSTQLIRAGLTASSVNVDSTQYKVFNGWLLNGEVVDVPSISINADIEFTASITYKYDVKFMVNEDVYNEQLVIKDSFAVAPNNPTLPSCDFVGWTINGTDVINLSTYKITNHTTFKAKFSQWATVQFKYENQIINTQNVSLNKYANDVSVQSTDKKVFKGWSIDGINVVSVANTPITKNTIFVALIDYYYDVSITKDGSSVYSARLPKNATINYSANTERQYYTFDGYFVGNTQINLSTYKITSDVTIVEKYTINSGMYDYLNDKFYTWQEMLDQGMAKVVDGHILEYVTTPNSYHSESDYCIDYNRGLFVVIDDSIDTIGQGPQNYSTCFYSQHFVGLYVPSSVQLIKAYAIKGISIQKLELYDFRGTMEVGCFQQLYSLEKVFLNKEVQIVQGEYHYDYMWQSQITVFTDAPSRPSYWCDEYNSCRYRVKGASSSSYYETTITVVYNSSYENHPYYYWEELTKSTESHNLVGLTNKETLIELQVSGITQADFDSGIVRVNINNETLLLNSLNTVSDKNNSYTFSLSFDNRLQVITLICKPKQTLTSSFKITSLAVEYYRYYPEVV